MAEAAAFVAQDSPDAARRLRDQVVTAARRIGLYPRIGATRPALAVDDIRFLVLRSLPYILVYRANVTPPRILRVLHGARDLPNVLREFEDG